MSTPQEPIGAEMPLLAHLAELRRRVIWVLIAIAAAFSITYTYSDVVLGFLEAPVKPFIKHLQFDTLTDPFVTHMKVAFYAAVFFAFPFAITQIWLFLKPGLYQRERKWMWPFLFLSYPLFIIGGSFVYYAVFPFAFEYLIKFDPTLEPSLRIGDYLSFVIQMIFSFGLIFELPLVVLMLTRLGLVTAGFLSRVRRYAIVIIFIVAAILTPTPDVFNQLLMAGPLWVLYEISIIVARLAAPKKNEIDQD